MGNISSDIKRLETSCQLLASQPASAKKVLNARFKVVSEKSALRKFLVKIPFLKFLFPKSLASTKPEDVASSLLKLAGDASADQITVVKRGLVLLKKDALSSDTQKKIADLEQKKFSSKKPDPTPEKSNTPPVPKVNPTTLIRSDLPQSLYCFVFSESMIPPKEKIEKKFENIKFLPTDIDQIVSLPKPCQILIFAPFNARIDGDRLLEVSEKLNPLCDGNLVVALIGQNTQCGFKPEELSKQLPAKDTFTCQFAIKMDASGMGKAAEYSFCNEKQFFDSVIAGFNKKAQ